MKNTQHSVMLACQEQVAPEQFRYPACAQQKVDGIRLRSCIDNKFRTRTNKLLPNREANRILSLYTAPYRHILFDGEITLRGKSFHETQSVLMSHDASTENLLEYIVFDNIALAQESYSRRLESVASAIACDLMQYIKLVPGYQMQLDSPEDFHAANARGEIVRPGWEGAMIKYMDAPYKFGRTTIREGYMFKWTQCLRASAKCIGVLQQQDWHMTTPALGSLIVEHPQFGEFNIGTGFTREQRVYLWREPARIVGHEITFEYKPHGVLNKPRHPSFISYVP